MKLEKSAGVHAMLGKQAPCPQNVYGVDFTTAGGIAFIQKKTDPLDLSQSLYAGAHYI